MLWGSSFLGNKVMLMEVAPLGALAARYLISVWVYLAMLALLARARGWSARAMPGRLLFVAIFGQALNFLGMTCAIPYLGAGTTSLAIMLVPVLTGLLAAASGLDRFSRSQAYGLLLALAGLLLVVRPGGEERSLAAPELFGMVFMLLGALGFAIFNVYARPLYAHYTALEVTAIMGVLSPLALLPFLAIEPTRQDLLSVFQLSGQGWLIAGYLALGSNVLAFFCWYVGLRRLGPNRLALFSYLIPVWAVCGAALWLDESVTLWLPAGVALVIGGIVVSSRRAARL